MPETVFGLPAHPLLVHGAAVLVPLAALLAIVIAVEVDQQHRRNGQPEGEHEPD